MVNVWGDAIATGCVAHMSRKEVADYENEQKMKNKSIEGSTNSEVNLVENMIENIQENPNIFKF